MRVALLLLVGCAGVRGALDDAGPELAERLGTDRVTYFGEGCYTVGERYAIYACSVDVLPIGERICSWEPRDGIEKHFDNPRLDSFERELNQHRCHRRWEQQIACDPVEVEAGPSSKPLDGMVPWPSDLATLRASVELSPAARADIFAQSGERLEAEVGLCAGNEGTIYPSNLHFIGHGTTPFYHDVLFGIASVATTREARGACFRARLVIRTKRCTNPSASVVAL